MADKFKKSNSEQSYRRARRRKQLDSAAATTDPYLSRNEFKEGFYDQASQQPITAETMYGKGTTKGFDYPTVDPDTSMMMSAMKDGGSVRGQKAIQVKKKIFKGVF
jgi:hypothetical protein